MPVPTLGTADSHIIPKGTVLFGNLKGGTSLRGFLVGIAAYMHYPPALLIRLYVFPFVLILPLHPTNGNENEGGSRPPAANAFPRVGENADEVTRELGNGEAGGDENTPRLSMPLQLRSGNLPLLRCNIERRSFF